MTMASVNMISVSIWGAALLLYLIFFVWHENWRGPLSQAEIAFYSARIDANANVDEGQRATLKKFMRDDTGRAFYMVNLLAFPSGKLAHPDSGASVSPPALLQEYYRPFIKKMLARASYPAITGTVVGGYIEAWATEANPGWSASGLVRYRSRRDLLAGVTEASFHDGHAYKRAAISVTFAVPIESNGGVLMSPRLWVALVLTTLAALGQVAYLTLRAG